MEGGLSPLQKMNEKRENTMTH